MRYKVFSCPINDLEGVLNTIPHQRLCSVHIERAIVTVVLLIDPPLEPVVLKEVSPVVVDIIKPPVGRPAKINKAANA